MTTTKAKSKPKPKSSPAKEPEKEAPVMDARGHKQGSRKAVIHALFDTAGPETAWTRGVKLGLKENTLRSWFGVWQRQAKKTKPAAKAKVSEKTATKPAEATQPTVQ